METESDRFNAAVGRQLRAEIAARGSSISAMARKIRIARSALDNYVTGKRAIPVPIAYDICAAINVAPHIVVMRAEERMRDEGGPVWSNVIKGRFRVGPIEEDEAAAARRRDPDIGDDL